MADFKIKCLNPIAAVGLNMLSDRYEVTEEVNDADGILVRSASMHDMEFSPSLKA